MALQAQDVSLFLRLMTQEREVVAQQSAVWMQTLKSSDLINAVVSPRIALFDWAVLKGDLPVAREAFIAKLSRLSSNNELYQLILESPWYAEARKIPEVSARLEQVRKDREEMHQQLELMLKGPDWQH